MKTIQFIFSKTFNFWIVIRIIVIFLFSASLFKDRHELIQFKTLWAFIYYSAFQLYILTLFILLIQYFLKRKRPLILQLYASIYSFYYSLIVSIDLYNQNKNLYLILPGLLFIYGIWQCFFDKAEIQELKSTKI